MEHEKQDNAEKKEKLYRQKAYALFGLIMPLTAVIVASVAYYKEVEKLYQEDLNHAQQKHAHQKGTLIVQSADQKSEAFFSEENNDTIIIEYFDENNKKERHERVYNFSRNTMTDSRYTKVAFFEPFNNSYENEFREETISDNFSRGTDELKTVRSFLAQNAHNCR